MTRRRAALAMLPLVAWALTGMSCEVGTKLNPTGTGHSSYEERWAANGPAAPPVMTDCKLTNDSGIEAKGITTNWFPCGRQFQTGIDGLSAFPGQAVGAAEANAAQQNFAAGFQAGLGSVLPAVCSGAAVATGAPWLAALCGAQPKPKPAPPPRPAPTPPAAAASPLLAPGLYLGPRGYRRELVGLEGERGDLVRYRSWGNDRPKVATVPEWLAWVVRPLPAR